MMASGTDHSLLLQVMGRLCRQEKARTKYIREKLMGLTFEAVLIARFAIVYRDDRYWLKRVTATGEVALPKSFIASCSAVAAAAEIARIEGYKGVEVHW